MSRRAAFLILALVLQACAALPVAGPAWDAGRTGDREMLVTLRRDRPEGIAALTQALASEYRLALVADWPLGALDLHCLVLRAGADADMADLNRRIASDPRVDAVQAMNSFAVLAGGGDPLTDLQRGLDEANARRAHSLATGRGVRVGLIDTGVDASHPDLRDRIAIVQDFTGPAMGGATGITTVTPAMAPQSTPERHGTALAGVVAAERNNGQGIVGVAPEAQLLGLRACWQQPGGADRGMCNSFTLARALHFAVVARPGVLNLSLQGPEDPLLSRLLLRAIANGTTVVAAYDYRRPGSFPASLPGVIAVAEPAAAGLNPPPGLLSAPGVDILSTAPGGSYVFMTGSSIAAAHVSGAAALLLEVAPNASPARIAALLRASSRPGAIGSGAATPLLNACRAVVAMMADQPNQPSAASVCTGDPADDAAP